MKKLLSLLLVALLVLPAAALADEVVNVFNWYDYIDESVFEQFTEETGIQVNDMYFTTNEEMMVQVEANPGAFDVCFPSEYIVERMLEKDLLAEINYDNVPNFQYTLESLQNPSYDPNNAHSVPYMWGTVGILYNTTMVEEPVDSWGILWDTDYMNNVFMLDSIRDTMGVTLKYLGYSMNTRDPVALEAAKQKLIEQKQSGVVKAYQVDETKDKMVAGEAALAVMWSGDAQYAIDLNPDLAYAIPKEGSNVWVDCMVIPKTAKNKENAEAFINFLCRPDISAANLDYIGYSTPETAAKDYLDEEVTSSPVSYPDDETLARSESFAELGVEATQVMNDLWLSVKTSTSNTTLYLILTIAAIAAVILFFVISGIVRRRKKARRCRKWKQA